MNASIFQCQNRVLGPSEFVDYMAIINQSYPPQALSTEPFIGFRVLCRDTFASSINPAQRIQQLDSCMNLVRGTGCLVRETNATMSDGYWIITLPVPRSQISIALKNLMGVLDTFEKRLGLVKVGLFDIVMTGNCHITQTENLLSRIALPQRYMQQLIQPQNTPYKIGSIYRINENYIELRTRWNCKLTSIDGLYEDLSVISQLLISIFH